MTQLEAADRAVQIWGDGASVIGVSRTKGWSLLGSTGAVTESWNVEVAHDRRWHAFDQNGHVTCGHQDCIVAEARL